MKTFRQPGETLTLTAPYDVASGAGVLVGAIFGIAQFAASETEPVEVARRGVFEHAKASAQGWTVGAKIYWDDTNKVLTNTASGNALVGVAVEDAANPSATGVVLLDGVIR